jgi:hypothetical protein
MLRASGYIATTAVAGPAASGPIRLYFSNYVEPPVAPPKLAGWENASWPRYEMAQVSSPGGIASAIYSEAGDHLVDANALLVQLVSPLLAAQTVRAQDITVVVQAQQADAGNHLHLAWALWVLRENGTVGPTVVGLHREPGELGLDFGSVADTATSTAVVLGAGDRLILELGLGGLPVDAAGSQSHSGMLRVGLTGTADLPPVDGSTTLAKPWLELADLPQPTWAPANGSGIPDTSDQWTADGVKVSTTSAVLRARSGAVVVSARTPATSGLARLAGPGRLLALAGRGALAAAELRGAGRTTTTAVAAKTSTATVSIGASARATTAVARASATAVRVDGRSATAVAATRTGLGSGVLRSWPRLAPTGARGSSAVVVGYAQDRAVALSSRQAAALALVLGQARHVAVGTRTGAGQVRLNGAGRGLLVAAKAVARVAGPLGAWGHLAATTVGSSTSALAVQAGARLAAQAVRGALTAVIQRASVNYTSIAASNGRTTIAVRAGASAATSARKATTTSVTLRGRPAVLAPAARGASTAVAVRGTLSVSLEVAVPAGVTSVTLLATARWLAGAQRGGLGTAQLSAAEQLTLLVLTEHSGLALLAARGRPSALSATSRATTVELGGHLDAVVLIGLALVHGRVTAGAATVGGVAVGTARIGRLVLGSDAAAGVAVGHAASGDVEAGTASEGRVLAGAGR